MDHVLQVASSGEHEPRAELFAEWDAVVRTGATRPEALKTIVQHLREWPGTSRRED
jgi:hypothetical protein